MKKLLPLLVVVLSTTLVFAQKEKVREGKFKNLKGITSYNIEFSYDNLEIPDYDSEEAYLDKKEKELEEDEPGEGKKFRKEWFSNRENHYEPKFIESFNKRFKDPQVTVKRDSKDRKYTIVVKTTMLYDGYNIGVWRKDAKLEATIVVFETNNPENILLEVDYSKVKGRAALGYDFSDNQRLGEAYAKLAKEFAKKIRKKAF